MPRTRDPKTQGVKTRDDVSQETRAGNRSTRAREKAERDMLAAQREQQAVELRLQGYEFEEIARRCQYILRDGTPNASAAYKAWKRALQKVPEPGVHAVRKQKVMAYNVARQALWDAFSQGDQDAIDSWLALDKREAELMGLDMKDRGSAAPTIVQRFYPSAWADGVVPAPSAQAEPVGEER